jgi:tellurite methyltransferase
MERAIESFRQDEHGDWVARLRCGHGQHVRHKPPFWSRPWVLTDEGRAEKIGLPLDCVLCDRFEMPSGYAAYKRTAELDESSIPAGLTRDHTTKPGVWAVIHVLAGRLHYIVESPLARDEILEPGRDGVVVPEVPHRVAALGAVRFFVEFHRAAEP